ncbi:MAG: outer membrane lipoprotein carrier protein LolA [Candidatus Krumholzibacteriia bacterium]
MKRNLRTRVLGRQRTASASLGVAVAVAAFFSAGAPGLAGRNALAGSRSRKADKIIRKHVKAMGGMENILAVDNMKVTGYMEIEGIEIDFTVWMQRPNRSRMEMSLPGLDIIQGFDGETAWWVNPLAGTGEPEEMPAALARELLRWTEFDGPLVNYKKKQHRVEYAGRQALGGGRTAHKIELTRKNREVWRVFIDTESYLEVMRTYETTIRGKAVEVTTRFSDFTQVEGLTAPRLIEGLAVNGSPYRMVFETFTAGEKVDKEFFSMTGALDR